VSKYLYCINDFGEDFITTSFEIIRNGNITTITIYNFNSEIDITKLKYVAVDYTNTTTIPIGQYHNGWGSQSYKNSDQLKFHLVSFLDQDIERKTVNLELIKINVDFDLGSHKRDLKIDNIIT